MLIQPRNNEYISHATQHFDRVACRLRRKLKIIIQQHSTDIVNDLHKKEILNVCDV